MKQNSHSELPNPQYGRIRSFSARGKRLGEKYKTLQAEFGPQYFLDFPPGTGISTIREDARIDLAAAFPHRQPLIIEIGPGSGEQLIHAAQAHPQINFLALEAWQPGAARCLAATVAAGVENVRIAQLDAAQSLPILFPPDSAYRAREIWTFFPDPWRKKKHRKRRLVSPQFAYIVAGALEPGGCWRLATDWDNYAWQMRDVLQESPWFDNPYLAQNPDAQDEGIYAGGFAPRYSGRVLTRFESRGQAAQRRVHDLYVIRNQVALAAAVVPEDPWVAAAKNGQEVEADRGGERPPSRTPASTRAGKPAAENQKRK